MCSKLISFVFINYFLPWTFASRKLDVCTNTLQLVTILFMFANLKVYNSCKYVMEFAIRLTAVNVLHLLLVMYAYYLR